MKTYSLTAPLHPCCFPFFTLQKNGAPKLNSGYATDTYTIALPHVFHVLSWARKYYVTNKTRAIKGKPKYFFYFQWWSESSHISFNIITNLKLLQIWFYLETVQRIFKTCIYRKEKREKRTLRIKKIKRTWNGFRSIPV